MTELLRVMEIIDQNSNVLSEGEYLEVCNLLKKSYDVRTEPIFIFNYDEFNIPPIAPMNTFEYFYDYYFDKALTLDCDLISLQINYLQDEINSNQEVKRLTKGIRETMRKHLCMINGDITGELSLEDMDVNASEFRKICKNYIHVENYFRLKYRNLLKQRIERLEGAYDHLDAI